MVRRTYTIVGVASVALVGAMVAATISSGSFFTGRKPPPVSRAPGPLPPSRPDRPVTGTDSPLFPPWLVVALTVLLSLYALVLLMLVLFARRSAKEDGSEVEQDGPALDEPWRSILTVELADAAGEQLSVLDHGTPRNAIVACWMSLQAATQRAGLAEEVTETSMEFTLRAMRGLGLDASAIAVLGGLYREARFSDHEMAEEQRQYALESVRVLVNQLTAGAYGRPDRAAM